VTHVADPALAGDLGLDRGAERVGQQARDPADRDLLAAVDVQRLADRGVAFQSQPAGLGDVADIDEVATLLAILEDQRRPVVQEPRREDRENPAIGVAVRLMRSIDIEEAQRHRRDVVSAAGAQAKLLLAVFRQCVDRLHRGRLRFRCRQRFERTPGIVDRLPHAAFEFERGALDVVCQAASAERYSPSP
jgi:hypothetical protein